MASKNAYFWDDTREISLTRAQPTSLELSRARSTTRLSPGIAAGLRRGRSAPEFEAFEVDQLYWKTLLRYDRDDATATRRQSIKGSFAPHQLRTARDLFASCHPDASMRALAHGDPTPPPPRDDDDEFVEDAADDDDDAETRDDREKARRIEELAVDVSDVYQTLRKTSSGLFSTQATSEGTSSKKKKPKHDGRLWDLLDASSCFAVANELYRLARLDEANANDETNGPLALEVRWPNFLAILALIRDRSTGASSGGSPRDVLEALGVELDERSIDPGATQRKDDRVRAGKKSTGSLAASLARDRANRGAPTVRLQSHPSTAARPPPTLDLEIRDVHNCLVQIGPTRLVAAQRRFERMAARASRDAPPEKPRNALLASRPATTGGRAKTPVRVKAEFDYRGRLEKRRTHQRELQKLEKAPRFKQSVEYKACGLCLRHYPSSSFWISSAHDKIIHQLRRFGLSEEELVQRGAGSPALCYTRLPLCCFCAQFMDPDEEDGLALRVAPDRDTTCYEKFFDAAYPETYTAVRARLGEGERSKEPL